MTDPKEKGGTSERREHIAQVLVESTVAGDKATAEKHGISVRTLQRWRRSLDGDDALSRVVAEKKAKVEEGWADEIPGALRAGVAFLRKAAENADQKCPQAIHAVAGALKILSDVSVTWKVLDARLSRQAGPDRTADRPVDAEGGAAREDPDEAPVH